MERGQPPAPAVTEGAGKRGKHHMQSQTLPRFHDFRQEKTEYRGNKVRTKIPVADQLEGGDFLWLIDPSEILNPSLLEHPRP